jgi:hypothetical protein
MANSIPKKRAKAEQLRERRAQAAVGLATGAKKSVAAVPIASKPRKLSASRAEPLPPMSYPVKRVAIGKRHFPRGAG